MGRDISKRIRVPRAPSNPAWDGSRDGASPTTLGNLSQGFTNLILKNSFHVPALNLPSFKAITPCPTTTGPVKLCPHLSPQQTGLASPAGPGLNPSAPLREARTNAPLGPRHPGASSGRPLPKQTRDPRRCSHPRSDPLCRACPPKQGAARPREPRGRTPSLGDPAARSTVGRLGADPVPPKARGCRSVSCRQPTPAGCWKPDFSRRSQPKLVGRQRRTRSSSSVPPAWHSPCPLRAGLTSAAWAGRRHFTPRALNAPCE